MLNSSEKHLHGSIQGSWSNIQVTTSSHFDIQNQPSQRPLESDPATVIFSWVALFAVRFFLLVKSLVGKQIDDKQILRNIFKIQKMYINEGVRLKKPVMGYHFRIEKKLKPKRQWVGGKVFSLDSMEKNEMTGNDHSQEVADWWKVCD